MTDRELDLRRRIFRAFAETGSPPAIGDDERETLAALAARHVVALDGNGQIRMAHPFAAHHDGARVESDGNTWWGNCAWDAFGIAAALRLKAFTVTGNGVAAEAGGLFHVAVPAAHWWDDIAFT